MRVALSQLHCSTSTYTTWTGSWTAVWIGMGMGIGRGRSFGLSSLATNAPFTSLRMMRRLPASAGATKRVEATKRARMMAKNFIFEKFASVLRAVEARGEESSRGEERWLRTDESERRVVMLLYCPLE